MQHRSQAAVARRLRGAALLKAQRFDEAFSVLDSTLDRPGQYFVAPRLHLADGAREEAVDALAMVATWATGRSPDWVAALGYVAETHSEATLGDTADGPALTARFEAALTAMVERSPRPERDLDVVIRQSRARGMERTAGAAERRLASLRG